MKFILYLLSFFVFLSFFHITGASKCAFVTLLYESNSIDGKGFTQGAQVLGFSLQKTKTKNDMIALVTEQVPPYHKSLLTDKGWKIHEIQSVKNHNTDYPARLDYVFSKLKIFSLAEYETVVYLDADTVVLENIDHLCSCPTTKYCAVVRNTFFNSGVMVVKPNLTMYQDMAVKSTAIHSYTGGDQGFFNNYFWNTENCPFYDFKDKSIHFTHPQECIRLPSYYNGDVAMFVARNDHWQFDPEEKRKEPAIMHFTMSILKPWNWVSYLFISECWVWWDYFSEMESLNVWFGIVSTLLMIACLLALHYALSQIFLYLSLKQIKYIIPVYGAVLAAILCQLLALGFAFIYSNLTFLTPMGDAFVFCLSYITFLDILYSKVLIEIFVLENAKKIDHREEFFYDLITLFFVALIAIFLGLMNIPEILVFRIAILVCGLIIVPLIFLVCDVTKKFTYKTNFFVDNDSFGAGSISTELEINIGN